MSKLIMMVLDPETEEYAPMCVSEIANSLHSDIFWCLLTGMDTPAPPSIKVHVKQMIDPDTGEVGIKMKLIKPS